MFCLKSLKVKGRKKNKYLLASVSLEKLESKRKKKETKISLPLFRCPLAPAAPDCRGQHWQFLQGPFDILFSNIVRNNFGLHSKIIVVDIISIRTSILAYHSQTNIPAYHNPQIYRVVFLTGPPLNLLSVDQ